MRAAPGARPLGSGALLARAHAHTADPLVIGAYCGKGEQLDDALADFAVRYADRTEAAHAELLSAVRGCRHMRLRRVGAIGHCPPAVDAPPRGPGRSTALHLHLRVRRGLLAQFPAPLRGAA